MSTQALAKTQVNGLAEQRQQALTEMLTQSTPHNEIRWRPGKGGRELPYTDTAYVIRTLNQIFAWDWDFIADNEELLCNGERPFEVKVRGRLMVRMDGREITKTQFGSQPIEYLRDGSAPVSIGDAFKGAASDALKKCASLLGIALDVYDSDSAVHKGQRQNQAPQRQTPKPDERRAAFEAQKPTRSEQVNTNGEAGPTEFWAHVKRIGIQKEDAAQIANLVTSGKLTWAEAITELPSE